MVGDGEQRTPRAGRVVVHRLRRKWRRIDWARFGTQFTLLLGAIGLLITGISTYFGMLVSRDQLKQSQEKSERETTRQARLLGVWEGWDQPPGKQSIHLMNRSPDPVAYVRLIVLLSNPQESRKALSYALVLPSLPPCTEVTWRVDPAGFKRLDEVKAATMDEFILTFYGDNGAWWVKDLRGIRMGLTAAPAPDAHAVLTTPTMKSVSFCGGGSGEGSQPATARPHHDRLREAPKGELGGLSSGSAVRRAWTAWKGVDDGPEGAGGRLGGDRVPVLLAGYVRSAPRGAGAYGDATRAALRSSDLHKSPPWGRACGGGEKVPPAGLEPAAKCLEGTCSIH